MNLLNKNRNLAGFEEKKNDRIMDYQCDANMISQELEEFYHNEQLRFSKRFICLNSQDSKTFKAGWNLFS